MERCRLASLTRDRSLLLCVCPSFCTAVCFPDIRVGTFEVRRERGYEPHDHQMRFEPQSSLLDVRRYMDCAECYLPTANSLRNEAMVGGRNGLDYATKLTLSASLAGIDSNRVRNTSTKQGTNECCISSLRRSSGEQRVSSRCWSLRIALE